MKKVHLKEYFSKVADIVSVKAELAGLSNHAASMGDSREIIIEEFLKKHIPSYFSVHQGGKIFGIVGDDSRQVDIIIKNGFAPNFKELGKMFDFAESVISVISVKSNLNNAKLKEALTEIESIPSMSSNVVELNRTFFPTIDPPEYINQFLTTYPTTVVFSYKGIDLKTMIKHVENYYSGKSSVNLRVPKLIWVNKKYYFASVDLEYIKVEGARNLIQTYAEKPEDYIIIPQDPESLDDIKYIFQIFKLSEQTQGDPFLYLLGQFTSYGTWINNLKFNFEKYFY